MTGVSAQQSKVQEHLVRRQHNPADGVYDVMDDTTYA